MADVKLNTLPQSTSPTSTQDLLLFDESTNAGQRINYNTLADVILAKLTSKTYTVGGGTQTLISAIDALNSKMNTSGSVAFTLTNANPTAPIDTYLNSMGAYEGRWIEIQIDDSIVVDGITVPPGRRLASIFRHSNVNYAIVNMYGWAGYQVMAVRNNGTWTWNYIMTNTEIDALNRNCVKNKDNTDAFSLQKTTDGRLAVYINNTWAGTIVYDSKPQS